MKKAFLFFLLSLFLFSEFAFAYSKDDVAVANILARYWLIQDYSKETKKYRLDDLITRAELIGIALKRKWIVLPEKYTCKNYFTDVKDDPTNNWKCRAIEMAADNDIISRANTKARPNDPITLIEALAIILKSGDFLNKETPFTIPWIVGWQNQVLWDAAAIWLPPIFTLLNEEGSTKNQIAQNNSKIQKNINVSAKRREVFRFMNDMNEMKVKVGEDGYWKSYYFVYFIWAYTPWDGKLEGRDARTFELLDNGYTKDKNGIYSGSTLLQGIDISTFSSFKDSNYVQDKNGIYYYDYAGLKKLDWVDSVSFTVLSMHNYGPVYAKDKNNIYLGANVVTGVDVNTFEIINDDFTKDKNHVYNGLEIAKSYPDDVAFDPVTFHALNHPDYTADKNGVYQYVNKIEWADPQSFVLLPYWNIGQRPGYDFYGKDKNYIYRWTRIDAAIDVESATTLIVSDFDLYSSDSQILIFKKNGKWWRYSYDYETGKGVISELQWIDHATFHILEWNRQAQDKNHTYEYDFSGLKIVQ